MTRCARPRGGRLAALVLLHSAVCLPPAVAGPFITVSDGGISLEAAGAGDLRFQVDGDQPLPPVSVDHGSFHVEVATLADASADGPDDVPIQASSGEAATGETSRPLPGAALTGVHVAAGKSSSSSRGDPEPGHGGMTFSFRGVGSTESSQKFRYRLVGLDPDWIETDRHSARYPSPQPGSYRFEVMAMNGAGRWSEPAALPFTVSLPWWRQPLVLPALGLMGIVLTGSLVTAVRSRRLLQIERLRATIAAGLHDEVGAGLTDIAILSEVAARKAGDLPELARVAATARELVDGMGDLVWLVNPRRDSLFELFVRLKDGYAELFACSGAQLEVGDLAPLEGVRLPLAYRQDLHFLFREALRNALRHSGCRRAELCISLHGRKLEVSLRDDGHGFNPKSRNGNGLGLETMRRRADQLGGCLTIESSPQGTEVRFAGRLP
jgi:signal transduction histidine kinase